MHTSVSTVRPIIKYIYIIIIYWHSKLYCDMRVGKKKKPWKTQYKRCYKSEVRAYYVQNIAEVLRRYVARQLRPDIYSGKENLHFEGQSGQVSWLPFKTEKCV